MRADVLGEDEAEGLVQRYVARRGAGRRGGGQHRRQRLLHLQHLSPLLAPPLQFPSAFLGFCLRRRARARAICEPVVPKNFHLLVTTFDH